MASAFTRTPYRDTSLPQLAEDIIDDIVESAAEMIDSLLDDFMPDGIAFGQRRRTEREQLDGYLQSGLHGDSQAAGLWYQQKVDELLAMLTLFGIPPDQIAKARPWDIVIAEGLKMSAKREKELGKQAEKAWAAQPDLPGSVPFVPMDPSRVNGDASRSEVL